MNQPVKMSPFDAVGGRKFVGLILSVVALVLASATGVQIPDDVLQTITWLFSVFVAGNAVENVTRFKSAKDMVKQAEQADAGSFPVGDASATLPTVGLPRR